MGNPFDQFDPAPANTFDQFDKPPANPFDQFGGGAGPAPVDNRADVGFLESAARKWITSNAAGGKYLGLAASAPAVLLDKLRSDGATPATDYAFKHWVDPYQASIDRYNIQPNEKQSFMGKLGGAAGGLAADLPLMVASGGESAPAQLAGTAPGAARYVENALNTGFDAMRPVMVKSGAERAEDVLSRGGSTTQALGAGETAGMLTGFTGAAPMSLEGKLLTRAATGIPVAAATNEAARRIQNAAMPAGMEQQFDPEDAAVGAITGGAMAGAMGHGPGSLHADTQEVRARNEAVYRIVNSDMPVAEQLQAIRALNEPAPGAAPAAERVEPTLPDTAAAAAKADVWRRPIEPSADILNAQSVDEAIAAAKVELPPIEVPTAGPAIDAETAAAATNEVVSGLPAKRLLSDRGIDAAGQPWEHDYRATPLPDGGYTVERVVRAPDGEQVQKLGKDGAWTVDGEPAKFDKLKWATEAALEQKANQPRDGTAVTEIAQAPHAPEFDDVRPDPVVNSAGRPVAPTAEGQRNFKEWFNGSEVADDDGAPIVMYHGTGRDFNVFKAGEAPAIFLTPSAETAGYYAHKRGFEQMNKDQYAGYHKDNGSGYGLTGENIMPVYVKAKHPFDFRKESDRQRVYDAMPEPKLLYSRDVLQGGDFGTMEHPEVQKAIKDAGYDSFYVDEHGSVNLGVFHPEQVKSAIGNNGEFSRANADIRYSAGEGAGMDVDALRDALTKSNEGQAASHLIDTGAVVLHQSADTLPAGVARDVGDVKAVATGDGTIHMVADNLTEGTARAVLLHEAFHQGAQSLLSAPAWSNLMARLGLLHSQGGSAGEFFDQARERVNAAVASGAVRPEHVPEEMAAYAVEHYASAPPSVRRVVDNLVGNVKAWALQKFGKQLGSVSASQLTALAKRALTEAARGKVGTSDATRFSTGPRIPEGKEGEAPRRLKQLSDRLMKIDFIRTSAEAIPNMVDDLVLKVMPMSARSGSDTARAMAKDYANAERNARLQWAHFDMVLEKNYTREEREAIWDAGDEQSVLLQQGLPTAGKGLDRLTDGQRATFEVLSRYGEELRKRAIDAGMFKGDGLPSWTPRVAVMIGEDGSYSAPPLRDGAGGTSDVGRNVSTNASSLKHRKYLTTEETEAAGKASVGEGFTVVRDIRTMPMAMARLERAIAARELVNGIKEVGRALGKETVSDTARPDFFTIDHPAFKTFRPRFIENAEGKLVSAHDENGDMLFDKVPVYVSREFEGPLKSVMSETSGAVYKGMMALKGAAMSVIMYSPLIHNMVEFGRALPLMPGKMLSLQVYRDGAKVRADPQQMQFFVSKGMVPIGHRGGIQDITGIMENPELNPGRSWTAKLLGGATGLVNKEAGQAVKRGVDAAGDFWHNTLLWDRVADLQAGLAANIYKAETTRLLKQGLTPDAAKGTAGYLAAHMANRYAGALPNEAMSAMSRKVGNIMLFSRSFTLGNLGVMKDMLSGLPIEVRSQIKRDYGDLAARVGTDEARRKAVAAFMVDVALMYGMNSLLQDVFAHWKRDKSWNSIAQGYVDRFYDMAHQMRENPMRTVDASLGGVAGGAAIGAKIGGMKGAAIGAAAGGAAAVGMKALSDLSSTAGNEPGKENRVLYDFDKGGTGIYTRLPTGKIGEEFVGWATSPLDMLKRKESTFTRPILETVNNDKGFGKRVYNPDDPGVAGAVRNVGKVVMNFMKAQLPVDAIQGLVDEGRGSADDTTAYKLIGPLAGLTFSKGAPGGPAVGEMYHAENVYRGQKADLMPTVQALIKQGKTDEAVDAMRSINMPNAEINTVLRYAEDPEARLNKSGMRRFNQHSDDDAKARMQRQLNSH